MIVESPNWDWEYGVCTKHYLPEVPCPACLKNRDPDITYRLTQAERDILDFDPTVMIEDFMPAPVSINVDKK